MSRVEVLRVLQLVRRLKRRVLLSLALLWVAQKDAPSVAWRCWIWTSQVV